MTTAIFNPETPLFNLDTAPVQITLVFLYLGILVAIAEITNRFYDTGVEFTRKIVHIGTGNVILLAWGLSIPPWIAMLASLVAAITAIVSYFIPILPSINSVGRHSLGTFCYAVSIGLLTGWFFPLDLPQFAVIGILVMAWGDGLAAVVGKRFGQHGYQLAGIKKSWEGSITMFLASFGVISLVLLGVYGNSGIVWIVALGVSAIATALETFSFWGIDNLTVPLGSAAASFYLCQLLF